MTVVFYLYSCCYHIYYSSVIYLVIQFFISAVVLIIIYALFICTSCSLYTHTHHGRVLTTLDLHVQILDGLFPVVQVFDETVHYARSLSSSLFLVFSSLLYFCHFLIPPLSLSAAIFLSLFICYHCDCHGYVLLQCSMIIVVMIYSLFRLI